MTKEEYLAKIEEDEDWAPGWDAMPHMEAKDIERLVLRVKENTKTECIKIKTKICDDPRLPLTRSKFGGHPYWPNNKPYPKAEHGIPLTMLAQINLSELPENDTFPNKGLLQFFIWNAANEKNYKVIYHEDYSAPVSRYLFTSPKTSVADAIPNSCMPETVKITKASGEKVVIPNIFWGKDGFPVKGVLNLEFSKGYDFVNPTENCFEAEFVKAAKQLNIPIPDNFDVCTDLPDEIRDRFYEYGVGHKLLGRPYFIQCDYREGDSENNILLFQMDSACSDSDEMDEAHNIVFGDSGIAGFFMTKEELRKLDFSHVYYEWECM